MTTENLTNAMIAGIFAKKRKLEGKLRYDEAAFILEAALDYLNSFPEFLTYDWHEDRIDKPFPSARHLAAHWWVKETGLTRRQVRLMHKAISTIWNGRNHQ